MSDILDDIAVAQRQIQEDGQMAHKVKMHPATLRDFFKECKRFSLGQMVGDPHTVFGLLLEGDVSIPMGRVAVFDADGDLLVKFNGEYIKASVAAEIVLSQAKG